MIGVISDIHGNYPALQAVLKELDIEGCSQVISLGDVCGYYCMINECIDELRNRDIINIMGNHDKYIAENGLCERSYTVNICLDYQRQVITQDNFEWVKASPLYIMENNIWMVHGGWNDYIDEYIIDFSFLDFESNIDIYVSGHTHVQKMVTGKCGTYFNPGSVGQPRDYMNSAAYALIDDNRIFLKRVEYDIDKIVFEMRKAGFETRVSNCLYYGCKIGENDV